MFIARWQIQARFGQKQKVLDQLRIFARDIAPAAGWAEGKGKLLSGSIGVSEATVEHNWTIESLDELERVWAKTRRNRGAQALGPGARTTYRLGLVAPGRIPSRVESRPTTREIRC